MMVKTGQHSAMWSALLLFFPALFGRCSFMGKTFSLPLQRTNNPIAKAFTPHRKVLTTTTKLCASEINSSSGSSTNSSGSSSGPNTKTTVSNSTIPPTELIASKLGVQPPRNASSQTWKRAMKLHRKLIPILHSTDSCQPPDSSLNIACMWWKAQSGNDPHSPVYDSGLAYDLLPSGWRRILKRPFRNLYPRLHHANVELRTAYLDQEIERIIMGIRENNNISNSTTTTLHKEPQPQQLIRLVCMGAGYDTRGIKMMERGLVDQVVELDLPEVVGAKQRLFERLRKRRAWLKESSMPILIASDFNNSTRVERVLSKILLQNNEDKSQWHTIFVFEGVMIYLNKSVPSSLLKTTSQVLRENNLEGSLCFADRLENVPGGDITLGTKELESNGWTLQDWSPKAGLARHMGTASLYRL